MSTLMDDEIKRWMARCKSALVLATELKNVFMGGERRLLGRGLVGRRLIGRRLVGRGR